MKLNYGDLGIKNWMSYVNSLFLITLSNTYLGGYESYILGMVVGAWGLLIIG